MSTPVDTPTTLGKILRRLREARGMSQEELARRADMTADRLGRLERGKQNGLTTREVNRLVELLECPRGILEKFSRKNKRAEFGRKLLEIRRDRGITQKQLAKETGIPRSQISGIERGEAGVGCKTAAPLLKWILVGRGPTSA